MTNLSVWQVQVQLHDAQYRLGCSFSPFGPYADLVVLASSLQASIFRSTASSKPLKCCKQNGLSERVWDVVSLPSPSHSLKADLKTAPPHRGSQEHRFNVSLLISSKFGPKPAAAAPWDQTPTGTRDLSQQITSAICEDDTWDRSNLLFLASKLAK